jgi:hypothetical protein
VATTRPALAGAIANLSNAPNPFRSETTIRFTLSREAFARLEVYSVEGRALRASTLGRLVAGAHAHALRAVDDDGRALAPGTYAYRIISDAGGASGRFTILR